MTKKRELEAWRTYFSEKSHTHRLYAVTVTYVPHGNGDPRSERSCQKALKDIYNRMCQVFVRERNYARPKYRHLMPILLAFLEKSESVGCHHHCVLAVPVQWDEAFRSLLGTNTLKGGGGNLIGERTVLSSEVKTPSDEGLWDIGGWLAYCTKRDHDVTGGDSFAIFGPRLDDVIKPAADAHQGSFLGESSLRLLPKGMNATTGAHTLSSQSSL